MVGRTKHRAEANNPVTNTTSRSSLRARRRSPDIPIGEKATCADGVIAAAGDRCPAGVAQQLAAGRGAPLPGVLDQSAHQGAGDRLPTDRLAFLPTSEEALVRVQVLRADRERPGAAAGSLG